MTLHFLVYGALGWCSEIVWTAAYEFVTGERVDPADPCACVPITPPERWRLAGHTYLWMFPLYGLGGVAFERLHDAARATPWLLRGLLWVLLIFLVEYVSGWILRRTTGRCPWDYSYTRWHVHGLIRLDYAPVWFAFGFLLEQVHDRLLVLPV